MSLEGGRGLKHHLLEGVEAGRAYQPILLDASDQTLSFYIHTPPAKTAGGFYILLRYLQHTCCIV
jgi:hypothetical protein